MTRHRPVLRRLTSGRPRLIALGVLAVVVAGLAAWALWPDPEPRQREYHDATACLLTDAKGVLGDPAKPVWSAMQDASTKHLVRVQYLQVNGPQTVDNAGSYIASLVGSRCGVVIAVGTVPVDAVIATAPSFPTARFVTVGDGKPAANVSVIADDSAAALRAEVGKQVAALAPAAS